jgi:aminoglycoside phosphotransferase (APT) family kinase protein
MTADRDHVRAALARFIADQTGHAAEVDDVRHLLGGFSYETWRLRARWHERGARVDAPLIMRRAPRGGVLEPYDPEREFRVLRALEGSAVPVPRALWLEPTGAILERPFYLMEFLDGEVPLPWGDAVPAARRLPMHEQFADVLAAVHGVDWERLGLAALGVPRPRDDAAGYHLDRWQAVLERVALRPYPLLEEVIAWLRAERPHTARLVLNHGDYRMGNFIWRDGSIRALIDWELTCIGDPLADVAFSRLPLAGWCSIAGDMAARYSARSGIPIDESRMDYYVTFELLKATIIGLTGLRAFAEGRTCDLRLLQVGHVAHGNVALLARRIGLTP